MAVVTIIGAGMMGSAMCWPLVDNGHTVRLVGTPLDEGIISSIRENRVHPKLKREMPDQVKEYFVSELSQAMEGAELILGGISSFGVDWFAEAVGPNLRPEMPVLTVTKGMIDRPDGHLDVIPVILNEKLPGKLKGKISFNAIAGPCIAHELAARRQTGVVFTGNDMAILSRLRGMLATPYYHIWPSNDVVGVEACAALKNAYAMGVSLAAGMMEAAGPDGLANMYNPQAALFGQACYEMRKLIGTLGGRETNTAWLPGAGDLYVTVFGGRTMRLGKLLGQGKSFEEARSSLAGETLESVEIITRVARALPKLASRGLVADERFPIDDAYGPDHQPGEVGQYPLEFILPQPMKTFLSIDVGTSSTKLSLFGENGEYIASRSASYPVDYPHSEWAEQDPEEWWRSVCKLGPEIMLALENQPLSGISVSGQTPLCVPVDPAGASLRKAILWLDRRSTDQVEWLRSKIGEDRLRRISSNRLDSYFGGSKWLWFQQEEPAIFARTWKILQANGYIIQKLTRSRDAARKSRD